MFSNNIIKNLGLLISKIIPIHGFYIIDNQLTIIGKHEFQNILFTFLNKYSLFQFKLLTSITAVDYITTQEVVYELLSIQYNYRIRIKFIFNINQQDTIKLNSLNFIYPNSGWWEREVWDMFGIFFNDNNDLRRILTDYGFEGFPLLKTYPVEGFVELHYNTVERTFNYNTIELAEISKTTHSINWWW